MTHREYSIKHRGTDSHGNSLCNAHEITFGGKCLGCGWEPDTMTDQTSPRPWAVTENGNVFNPDNEIIGRIDSVEAVAYLNRAFRAVKEADANQATIERMREALESALRDVENGLGEWRSIESLYAPDSLQNYKDAQHTLSAALEG